MNIIILYINTYLHPASNKIHHVKIHKIRTDDVVLFTIIFIVNSMVGRDKADISLIMEYMHMDLDQCMKTYSDIPLPYKTSIVIFSSYVNVHFCCFRHLRGRIWKIRSIRSCAPTFVKCIQKVFPSAGKPNSRKQPQTNLKPPCSLVHR